VSRTVAGAPFAIPAAEPKLDLMSLRTMPLSDNALGPLDPFPGNGPAVSSGIGEQLASVAVVSVTVPDELEPDVSAAPAVLTVPLDAVCFDDVQPASVTTPAPASSLSRFRRCIRGDRSKSPRSCSIA
jgi:hypothetical protein